MGIVHHEEGVDLLPANIELSAVEASMANVMSRELMMQGTSCRSAVFSSIYTVKNLVWCPAGSNGDIYEKWLV